MKTHPLELRWQRPPSVPFSAGTPLSDSSTEALDEDATAGAVDADGEAPAIYTNAGATEVEEASIRAFFLRLWQRGSLETGHCAQEQSHSSKRMDWVGAASSSRWSAPTVHCNSAAAMCSRSATVW